MLKQQLIKRTSASEQRRLQQLLTTEELGDCKSSQVLRRIQQLLGDKANTMDAEIMQELFLQCLPANIRMVLTPLAGELNLDKLAQLADHIVEASPMHTIAATEPDMTTSQLTAQVNDLAKRLDELISTLTSTINNFTATRRTRSPSPWRRLPLPLMTIATCAGTTGHLVMMPKSANLLVRSRETPRPVASGDERCWPHP